PMRRAILSILVLSTVVAGQQTATRYDYLESNRDLIYRGMQALFTCNGLFVSNRTLEQLNAAELKMDRMPLAPEVQIDRERKAVAIGDRPTMRAAYREGLGCVVMGPEQTFADIDSLPILKMPATPGDASRLPWPDGD